MGPSDADIAAARTALALIDPLIARAHQAVPPISWRIREPGFTGLIHQIVGQQVSVAAADATRRRMIEGLGGELTPERVLAASDQQLRGFGLSSHKIRYARAIAEAAEIFNTIAGLSDEAAVEALMAVKGVGRWTAETYLMFSESRFDLFPAGDLALKEGFRLLEGGAVRPTEMELHLRAQTWRPYRGIAALLLWSVYRQARSRETEAFGVPVLAPRAE